MPDIEKKVNKFQSAVKYTGLVLLVIMLLSHIFFKPVVPTWLVLIPSTMIGLADQLKKIKDIKNNL